MPLTYDDIPGSWGTYSEGWPEVAVPNAFTPPQPQPYVPGDMPGALARQTYRARSDTALRIAQEAGVPYGSYVVMGAPGDDPVTLRVETPAMLAQVREVIRRMEAVVPDAVEAA